MIYPLYRIDFLFVIIEVVELRNGAHVRVDVRVAQDDLFFPRVSNSRLALTKGEFVKSRRQVTHSFPLQSIFVLYQLVLKTWPHF